MDAKRSARPGGAWTQGQLGWRGGVLRLNRSVALGLLVSVLGYAVAAKAEKFPNLANTPPMGWNSWNRFACNIDEVTVRAAADAMVSSGMQAAGYQYVNLDDCWQGQRDASGFIQPDPERFPSGMKALADYVHDKGLRFGLYSDAGWKTCGGRPGSRGYEFQDALRYAEWGVDYLKYDWCNTEGLNAEGAYLTIREALFAAKRPVVLSICEWGNSKPWLWAKPVGQLWRTTGDITHCFDCIESHGSWQSWGILQIVDKQAGLRVHAGPGQWNDPDMLEVGNGMSEVEDRAHFSLWALLAAPLIAGNDLATMSAATRQVLTNREVIAVDQDPQGSQGYRAWSFGPVEVWVKPLSGGQAAIGFLNRSGVGQKLHFDWSQHPIRDDITKSSWDFAKRRFALRDLWAHRSVGTTKQPLSKTLQPHELLLLRVSPLE